MPVSAVDLRLVPSALIAWSVTAAAILWDCGFEIAFTAALLGIAVLAVRRRPVFKGIAAGVIGAAAIGIGFGVAGALRSDAVRSHPIGQYFGTATAVTVVPTESPRSIAGGRVILRAALTEVDGAATSGRVTVFASSPTFGQLAPGQSAQFRARVGRPTRNDLTIAVLTGIGDATSGQAGIFQRAALAVRERFAAIAREVLPAEQAALLPGLVLGDTSTMTPMTVAQFRAAGLTHLTAVSGANVTIVCGAVLLSAGLLGPRLAVGLAGLTLIAFVTVVQPSASVLRAATMGAITLMALLSSRRRQAIPSLAACVVVLMMGWPQLAVDVGFALSVTATAALIVLAPSWSARLVRRGWPKPLADAVCVCAAAQLVTAPLVAAISGQFSVVAAFANLAVTAVVAPITVAGTAAAALCIIWPTAAELLIRLTGPELWWVLQIAQRAAAVPGAVLTVPSGFGGFVTITGATVCLGVLCLRVLRRRHGTIVE